MTIRDREAYNAYYRLWYQRNRERVLAGQKERDHRRREKQKRMEALRERKRVKASIYRQSHRDKILEQWRVARENDPTIRERDAEYARLYRAKLKQGYKPKTKRQYITHKGRMVRGYRVAAVARMIGCGVTTITGWHDLYAVIPEPRFDGYRLYTSAQIELMKQFYSISKGDHVRRSECSKRIFEDWWK